MFRRIPCFPGATTKELLGRLLALAGTVLFSGCGGGGATAEAGVPPVAPTPVEPAPVEPTPVEPPPATDTALDLQLATLAARADAAVMPASPVQDPDLVTLGQALFFDRILSGNRDVSCYTCHDVDFGAGDGLSLSVGTGGFGKGADRLLDRGRLTARNAPSILRVAGQPTMFWDSRVARRGDGTLATPSAVLNGPAPTASAIAATLTSALTAQAVFPLLSHDEMRGQPGENEVADAPSDVEAWARLMRRLVGTDNDAEPGVAAYRDLFALAFPAVVRWSDFHVGHVARAIAAFEIAAFDTRGSPFDAWLAGTRTALTDTEKRGAILFFGRAGCAACHGGPALTDGRHHAIGVPQVGPGHDFPFEDTGRASVTGDPTDRYRFRTPGLRNVALTGPWMHDGAYTTLGAAIRHYRNPRQALLGYDATQLAPLLRTLVDTDPVRQDARARALDARVRDGVELNDVEVGQLEAFLGALTDTAALDLSAAEPETVPSGLPIDD